MNQNMRAKDRHSCSRSVHRLPQGWKRGEAGPAKGASQGPILLHDARSVTKARSPLPRFWSSGDMDKGGRPAVSTPAWVVADHC